MFIKSIICEVIERKNYSKNSTQNILQDQDLRLHFPYLCKNIACLKFERSVIVTITKKLPLYEKSTDSISL